MPQPADDERTQDIDDRLDSWKEIAAFLQRDMRTVQRWEKLAGLPVHRHAESRLRTAYAYRSELDAWWRAQRTAVAAEERAPEPLPSAGAGRSTPISSAMLLAAAAVIIIAGTVAGLLVIRLNPGDARVPNATPGASTVGVLLTRFDDQAGDAALASVLEESVAQGLSRRAGIEVAAPARVARTLRLMRREPGARVTASVGREVCVRDGRLRFAVTGRIHKLQSRYFADLQAIDPADGSIRISLQRQAADRHDLLSGIQDEVPQFAARLLTAGTRSAATEPLEQVTTASLPALRLYTAAVQAGSRRQWGAAELLASRAIAADDQFASAYAWVGRAKRHQGRPTRECLPFLERAVALSKGATDRESYLISGTFNAIAGSVSSAVAAYEALLRLAPKDRQALDLLIDAYSRVGRVKEAVDLSVARAEYEPDDFYANVRAAHALMTWQGDAARASRFVRRAQQLTSPAAIGDRPAWAAWLSALPVFSSWLIEDRNAASESLARLERSLGGRLGRERDALATIIGFSHLAFGRVHDAERTFQQAASPARQIDLAMLALALGDTRRAREWLLQIRQYSAERPALFARVGLAEEAERGMETMAPSEHAEGVIEVTRGLIAARRGDHEAAMTSLRRGIELLRFSGEPEYFLAVRALARLRSRLGDQHRALQWLADTTGQRARTFCSPHWSAAYWIRMNAELAAKYRRQGRATDAERIAAMLRPILQSADTDHPIAAALRSPAGR